MGDSRRTQLLAATLIVALVAVMVVRSMGGDEPSAPIARAGARAALNQGSAPATGGAAAAAAPVDVNLRALRGQRAAPIQRGRDPFRFRPKAPPPPPPGSTSPRPAVKQPELEPGPTLPPMPPPPPPLPPIPLKFIGVLQKVDGTKIAVFSDGRGTVHGVEGQEIAGRYKIQRIGVESAEVSYIDGRGRQTIRLTGQ